MLSKGRKYDLSTYAKGKAPEPVTSTIKSNQVTFPDLHGNALGALLRLEACGILQIGSDADRKRLGQIYLKGDYLTDADFVEFSAILERATTNKDKFKCVRFIGDIFGDRGKNDLLMLPVLKKIKGSGIHTEIMYSNHDQFFLQWFLSETVPDKKNEIHIPAEELTDKAAGQRRP